MSDDPLPAPGPPPPGAASGLGYPHRAQTDTRISLFWLDLIDNLMARQRSRFLSANAGETVGEPLDQGTIGTSPEA